MKNKSVLGMLILLALLPFSGKSQNLKNGLEAHYQFETNLLDETSNSYDLNVLSGQVSNNPVGTNDYSAVFNGATRLTSASSFDNSSFKTCAISLWVKSKNITSDLQICLQGAFMGFGAYIQPNTGKFIGFFDASSSGSYASSKAVTDGKWHHIVVQSDGATTYMYVDGVLDGSKKENFVVGNAGTNNKLYLGRSNLGVQSFTGELNDVRVYNRTLNQCDISKLYSIQNPSSISSYSFDGSLKDAEGNVNLKSKGSHPSFELFGTNDSAIIFNGSTQLTSASSFDNSSFTSCAISLWVKSNTITSDLQTCLQGAFMGFGAYIRPNTGKFIGFFDGSSSGSYTSSKAITDGQWHHIVVQSDGKTTSMYVDGVLDGSKKESFVVGDGSANNKLYLGKSILDVRPFKGSLNNISIYDRVLSSCEIDDLSKIPMTVGTSDPAQPRKGSVEVYPNPTADGRFFIDLKDNYKNITLQVTDVSGKVVQKKTYQHQRFIASELDVENGLYIIRVLYDDDRYAVSRLVRQ